MNSSVRHSSASSAGPPSETRGAALTLVISTALFAAVTGWRSAVADPAAGVGFLYVIPVAMVAARFGLRGGLAAAATATGLAMASSTAALGLSGYAVRAVAFVAVAAVVGWQVERRRQVESEADRWFSLSSDMCVVANLDGYFTRVNDAWTDSLGYSEEELLATPFVDFVHPDDIEGTNAEAAALADPGHMTVRFENRYRAKTGSWHWLQWASRSDGRHIYAAARDVTEQKRLEAELRELARSDALTGLANRRVWADRCAEEVRRAKRSGAPLSVAMIDLNGFKELNDSAGHAAGDWFLKAVAAKLGSQVRETDLLARLGGDEFGLLLPDCGTAHGIGIVDRMRAAMPDNQTFSAGVATWDGEELFDAVIRRADQGMYEDKKSQAASRA